MDTLTQGSDPERLLNDNRRRTALADHYGSARDVENRDWPLITNPSNGIYAAPARELNIRGDEVRAAHRRCRYRFLFVHGEREGREAEVSQAILDQLGGEKLILDDQRVHYAAATSGASQSCM